MRNTLHRLLPLALAFTATAALAADSLKIESTFSDTDPKGKPRTLKLPAATVESGRPAEIHVTPYTFKFTATLNDHNSVKIATIIENTDADGKARVLSRPTLLTTPGKAAIISFGKQPQIITLEQVVTLAK